MESTTSPKLYGNGGFRDSPPTYARIQNELRSRIASGEWRVGHRLPTEKEIARLYGTSRSTVQFALSRLVNDGWMRTLRHREAESPTDPGEARSMTFRKVGAWMGMCPGFRSRTRAKVRIAEAMLDRA